jgi:hypothetical protein
LPAAVPEDNALGNGKTQARSSRRDLSMREKRSKILP